MLVDNYPEFSTDLSDIFDTDLFNPSDFTLDSASSFTLPEYDFPSLSFPQLPAPYSSSSRSSLSSPSPFFVDNQAPIGIDPQLVDTPSAVTDRTDEDDSELEPTPPQTTDSEKPTIILPPNASAKPTINAHKSRKGTVLAGGIVKKFPHHAREKENTALSAGVAAAKKTAANKHARNTSAASSTSTSSSPPGLPTIAEEAKSPLTSFLSAMSMRKPAPSDDGDNDDDQEFPQDWRPSPEILAKMTSKEKRQLRNKISARNFRIRRKEYISTLEGDIAERDRLLDHFRSQLGSRESENIALRQEIEALKKALLDGRGLSHSSLLAGGEGMVLEDGMSVGINLPPPKMLPEQSAAEALMLAESAAAAAAANTSMSAGLLTPNTQKDLPTSRVGSSTSNAFWGGVGMGPGGITPVHTTLVPDVSAVIRKALMENINPSLNQHAQPLPQPVHIQSQPGPRNVNGGNLGGFDGFADAHPFTLKTLDAYRIHLWGKMAAQQSQQQHHHHQHMHSPSSSRTASPSPPASPYYGGGLAERLRPHFFSSSSGLGLLGKHSGPSSSSSVYNYNKSVGSSQKEKEKEREKDKQHQQQALIAAMASQTILKKLGNAFWDAFVGSSASSSTTSVAHSSNWDTDKVKRVLEGKAVLRVVDVDSLPLSTTAAVSTSSSFVAPSEKGCERVMCELLEESMRSLTIGKKA